jgi:predicted Rossmann fold nucleotide-binding protein DprA/Smf involved in DNA uptake
VLAALRQGRHTPDQLVAALGLPVRVVLGALASLEIEGLAEAEPGGRYRAKRRVAGLPTSGPT